MSEHTKGPWYWAEDDDEYGEPGIATHRIKGGEQDFVLATVLNDGPPALANARRIVACVNACQGIETEELERNGVMEELPRCDTCDRPFLDDDELSEQRGSGAHRVDVCPVCTTKERVKALEARLAEAREVLDDERCPECGATDWCYPCASQGGWIPPHRRG